jgi:hypothetical protein
MIGKYNVIILYTLKISYVKKNSLCCMSSAAEYGCCPALRDVRVLSFPLRERGNLKGIIASTKPSPSLRICGTKKASS